MSCGTCKEERAARSSFSSFFSNFSAATGIGRSLLACWWTNIKAIELGHSHCNNSNGFLRPVCVY